MKNSIRPLKTAIAAFAALSLLSTANAAIVSVTDGNGNTFGDTGGFAIDFDATTGLTADWLPDLSTSQLYSIDSVTVFQGSIGNTTDTVRLGVYTTLIGTVLSGFQGVSTNTINLAGVVESDPLNFSFSGINVTPQTDPGSGTDIRYFIFQTGTTALTSVDGQSTRVPVRRIDAENGAFGDELSGIIRSDAGGAQLNRSPEYSATITAVPEPSTLGLLCIAGAAIAARRRR